MKTTDYLKKYGLYALMVGTFFFTGCKPDDEEEPEPENEEEVITDVKLIFTNDNDPTDIVEASAQDPDGQGVQELKILNAINLDTSKTYTLTFEITNKLETPSEDIGEEIEEEAAEHQIFFSFSNNAFSNPFGNGNIDNASDPIVYNDKDDNGNNVGLSTTWKTSNSLLSNGTFTVRLQHQPDVKTSTSGATDGDTDFELEFVLNIQ